MDYHELYEVYLEVIDSKNQDKINEFASKYPKFYEEQQLRDLRCGKI